MKLRVFGLTITGLVIAVGSYVGYRVMKEPELISELTKGLTAKVRESRQKLETMSEDAVVRTAQLTRNPQITQDWVEKQWDNLNM
ncbi:hypothetical protein KPC83_07125 [Collinsella sp. zg1085]|uniref:hypothetical protein n=1 Tax=Collinsella sp. zg1085 TaxID=2844380 RepID=UPI001C0BB610|nr:hypothetical protein [Collinsella sp. zg1085]QWT17595.1 hypothetical protein KPC83_07125 [Collinsella sp. zg1085]